MVLMGFAVLLRLAAATTNNQSKAPIGSFAGANYHHARPKHLGMISVRA
jgi:hypothetical protein